jgi:predicted ATPase/DNA-binding CsgD family transcriptional regulator
MGRIDQAAWSEPLNRRETEILRLISSGLSNREIAQKLHLSPETIKWYNKQIFGKLGANSRTEAVAIAGENHLLTQESSNPDLSVATAEHNLPAQWTSFVGRKAEIFEIKALLRVARLVTLSGPGGTGKTRLALQVGHALVSAYQHGVWFVELASLSEPALVANAIAQTLRIATMGEEPLAEVLKRSLARKNLLLILDNFEHLLPAAPLVTELLSAAPQLNILVTSRERLHVYGEQEYAVNPLSVPDPHLTGTTTSQWLDYDAVNLFVQRARAARSGFSPDESQSSDIVHVCQRLDGLPLALELAASQIKYSDLATLTQRLQDSLGTLTSGPRDLPARQRTLRNTIEWSYNLLDEDEKRLFARLSIFSGGAKLEMIERVCRDNLEDKTSERLESLVDKNLVFHRDNPPGEIRFLMLETIREYALECLISKGEFELIHQRHAAEYVGLAENAEVELSGPRQGYWYMRLRAEQDNLRAVLAWSLEGKSVEAGMRIISALQPYWYYTGAAQEGLRWCNQAIESSETAALHRVAGVYRCAGEMCYSLGDVKRGAGYHRQALELYRKLGDRRFTAYALIYLGCFAYAQVEPDVIAACISQCLEGISILGDLIDPAGQARGWNILGEIYRFAGDYEAANHAYEEALSLALACGDRLREAIQYENLGYIAYHNQDYQEALGLGLKAIQTLPEPNNDYGLAAMIAVLAGPLQALGAAHLAAIVLGAALTSLGNLGMTHQVGDQPEVDHFLLVTRQDLGEEAFQRAWEEGQGLLLQQVVELVLAYHEQGEEPAL